MGRSRPIRRANRRPGTGSPRVLPGHTARLDLNSDVVTTWFSVASPSPPEPGFKTIRVLGFDGSDPLVQVYVDEHTSEVWRLSAPGQATRLPDVPLGVLSPPFSVTDAHG